MKDQPNTHANQDQGMTPIEQIETYFEGLFVHAKGALLHAQTGMLPKALENIERSALYVAAITEMITENAALKSAYMDGRQFCKINRSANGAYTLAVSEGNGYRVIASGPPNKLEELASAAGFVLHDVASLFASPVKPGCNVNLYRSVSKISA